MRPISSWRRLGGGVVGLPLLAGVVLLLSSGTEASETAKPVCTPPEGAHPDARVVTNGTDPEGDPESTQELQDGSYIVARCDARGQLKRAQVVAPIRVPGGTTEMLVVREDEPDRNGGTLTRFQGWPDPGWEQSPEMWRRYGAAAKEHVLPRTRRGGGR